MEISILRQTVSFTAAMLILAANVGHQLSWIDSRKSSYNILNVTGSAVLAHIALHPFQVGFVVLEGAWTVVSLLARGSRQAAKPA